MQKRITINDSELALKDGVIHLSYLLETIAASREIADTELYMRLSGEEKKAAVGRFSLVYQMLVNRAKQDILSGELLVIDRYLGIAINDFPEVRKWCESYSFPAKYAELAPDPIIAVSIDMARQWVKRNGFPLPLVFDETSNESATSEKAGYPRRESAQAKQDQEVIEAIKQLGYNPRKLPKRKQGKAWVKSDVRNHLKWRNTIFDKTWERLRQSEEIAEDL